MTVEEMRKEIDKYCESQHTCRVCPLNDNETSDCFYDASNEDTIEAFNKLFPQATEEVNEEPTTEVENDVIKHPNHYCRENAMECIDEMVLVFGKEVVKHFCLCNIWKYRYRSSAKNGEEDIKKSDRYIQIYKELTSNE